MRGDDVPAIEQDQQHPGVFQPLAFSPDDDAHASFCRGRRRSTCCHSKLGSSRTSGRKRRHQFALRASSGQTDNDNAGSSCFPDYRRYRAVCAMPFLGLRLRLAPGAFIAESTVRIAVPAMRWSNTEWERWHIVGDPLRPRRLVSERDSVAICECRAFLEELEGLRRRDAS